MKTIISTLFLILPFVAAAEQRPAMSDENMQQLMQQMQKMQTCMQKIDQAELSALEQRSKEFESQIKSLCGQGKRDEAQEKAILFAEEISKAPAMKILKKCSEHMQGAMPAMPFTDQDLDFSNHHVCDELGGRD